MVTTPEGTFLPFQSTRRRLEQLIDVNRDFPFDYAKGPYLCLRSETSRAIQKLFSHNLFVATITFHGGGRSISYEWGDYYNHKIKARAPDYYAMKDIAETMNRFSGAFCVVEFQK